LRKNFSGARYFAKTPWKTRDSVAVPGTLFKEIVIELDILGQVYDFTGLEFSHCLENNGVAVQVLAFIVTAQAGAVDKLAAGSFKGSRDFIFWEDGFVRTLGHTGAAVNAGFRVDVHGGPFVERFSRDNAVDGAYLDATAISKAKAGNNIRHVTLLLILIKSKPEDFIYRL
jgi:hypothetical protein